MKTPPPERVDVPFHRVSETYYVRDPQRYGDDDVHAEDITLEKLLEAVSHYNFCEQIKLEIAWNTAYALGRKRWHWGPAWMVTVRGWLNTRWDLFKLYIKHL